MTTKSLPRRQPKASSHHSQQPQVVPEKSKMTIVKNQNTYLVRLNKCVNINHKMTSNMSNINIDFRLDTECPLDIRLEDNLLPSMDEHEFVGNPVMDHVVVILPRPSNFWRQRLKNYPSSHLYKCEPVCESIMNHLPIILPRSSQQQVVAAIGITLHNTLSSYFPM
ncbi:hypothetical protein CR513_27785, partial [Mucuna pruriens]